MNGGRRLAIVAFVAAVALVGCAEERGPVAVNDASAETTAVAPEATPTTTIPEPNPAAATSAPTAPTASELQRAVDEGHQPWRLEPQPAFGASTTDEDTG